MPAQTVSELAGKVLQAGIRTPAPDYGGRPYRYGWVQLLDKRLGEIVEVSVDIGDGRPSPFADLERGQYVAYPVGYLRIFNGVLTGTMVVRDEAADDHEDPERDEAAAF